MSGEQKLFLFFVYFNEGISFDFKNTCGGTGSLLLVVILSSKYEWPRERQRQCWAVEEEAGGGPGWRDWEQSGEGKDADLSWPEWPGACGQ